MLGVKVPVWDGYVMIVKLSPMAGVKELMRLTLRAPPSVATRPVP